MARGPGGKRAAIFGVNRSLAREKAGLKTPGLGYTELLNLQCGWQGDGAGFRLHIVRKDDGDTANATR